MKKNSSAIIFWGALWGLEEATLGHLLHVTTLNIGWFIWFPLAYFFMYQVFKQTGKLNSILFTAIVAAAIKFVNLFMTANLVIVICPALSILLEGISSFAFLKLMDGKKHMPKYKLAEIVTVSLAWRILFLIGLLALPTWIMSTYPFKGVFAIFKFILYEGTLNGLFIYGIIVLVKKINKINEKKNTYIKPFTEKIIKSKVIESISYKPVVSLSILAITLIIQWVL